MHELEQFGDGERPGHQSMFGSTTAAIPWWRSEVNETFPTWVVFRPSNGPSPESSSTVSYRSLGYHLHG